MEQLHELSILQKALVGLVALLLLAGCATRDTAVTAKRLDETHFRIAAQGRYITPQATVEEAVLLKAAETALEYNKAAFRIVDSRLSSTVSRRYLQTSAPHTFGAVIIIELVDTEAPLGDDYYAASDLVERLRPKPADLD